MHERHPHYKNLQKVNLLGDLATTFGVRVFGDDREYWQSIFEVSNAMDDIVDQDRTLDITPYINGIINGEAIPYLDQTRAKRFQAIYANLSDERRARLHQASRISEYAVLRHDATDLESYVGYTLEESQLYADILKMDTETPDHHARNRFNGWLFSLGRAGYAADTVVDMKSDYREGITQICPTPDIYRRLSVVACREIHQCLDLTPQKVSTMSILGGLVVKKCAVSLVNIFTDN